MLPVLPLLPLLLLPPSSWVLTVITLRRGYTQVAGGNSEMPC